MQCHPIVLDTTNMRSLKKPREPSYTNRVYTRTAVQIFAKCSFPNRRLQLVVKQYI